MKTLNLIKPLLVVVIAFVANVTISATLPDNNLIYNTEEVDGVKVSETVYKMDGNILTNYMKYNYKHNAENQITESVSQKWNSNKECWENDLCIRYTYDSKSVTTQYYKWNKRKKDFVLVPEMTVTMDK